MIGELGIRSRELGTVDATTAGDAARELENLGYGALWISGLTPDTLEDRVRVVLGATGSLVVATGIVSIWTHPASHVAVMQARLAAEFPGRFLLGLGVSHEPMVARAGLEYERPLAAMRRYLDELEAVDTRISRSERILAALAPRMLALSAERTAGSTPFLVSPEHTRWARGILGEGPLLAPHLKVVLTTTVGRGREAARAAMRVNMTLPNYRDNFLRSGFEQIDLENGGSDRLIDRVVAIGNVEAARARIAEHRSAGADHVVLEPVSDDDPARLPRAAWRELAPTAG